MALQQHQQWWWLVFLQPLLCCHRKNMLSMGGLPLLLPALAGIAAAMVLW